MAWVVIRMLRSDPVNGTSTADSRGMTECSSKCKKAMHRQGSELQGSFTAFRMTMSSGTYSAGVG